MRSISLSPLLTLAVSLVATVAFAQNDKPTTPPTTNKTEQNQPYGYPESAPAEPRYPGIPPTGGRVETTIGPFEARFYGTLLINFSTSDSLIVGQDLPLWPIAGSAVVTFPDGTTQHANQIHDSIFTARQSILGFTLNPANPSEDTWQPSGLLEFDFFGSRPVDTLQPQARVFNQPRLRLAYFQLQKGGLKFVAGQDRIIIAPLDPVSLSHVAAPLAATAGDLWGWLPQVRVDYTAKKGDTSALFQFGILRPLFGDPRLASLPTPIPSEFPTVGGAVDATFSGYGERSSQPFYQTRIAVSHPLHSSTATVGAGLHYGRERVGAQRTLDSWAFALDWSVPVLSRLTFRGEAYAGSDLVPFQGGILQGVAVLQGATGAVQQINKIGDGGGWGELIMPITTDNKNVFYLGASTDDPKDRNLLPGSGRAKNSMAWASYFRKLTKETTLALEYSNWQFRTRAFVAGQPGPKLPTGRANVFSVSLAYQF
jgi:hypothetical protein